MESHYSSSRAEATGLARTKSPERQRVTRHHSEPRETDILMNTFHSNTIENPAQKLTREPWSRLPPDAGKGGATETAANMRGANRLQPGADRSDYEGVNAFVYVEQWPESGVSRRGKRRRKVVSRGVTHSWRTASPSAITANCGRMRLPSRNALFSTTMERLRIERLIPCDRNAPDSASSVVPPSAPGRSGAGATAQVFSSLPRFTCQGGQPSERQRGGKGNSDARRGQE